MPHVCVFCKSLSDTRVLVAALIQLITDTLRMISSSRRYNNLIKSIKLSRRNRVRARVLRVVAACDGGAQIDRL